jgi:CTP synthase (UTP-ammonia lyase)
MSNGIRIGLIGDYDASVPAHQAIPIALTLVGEQLDVAIEPEWLPTDAIGAAVRLAPFAGLWCVPASPYRSMEGALLAIRHARTNGIPFLGTCGGFQHAILEYARNVLGWADADHGETSPGATRTVIAALACELVEATDTVRLFPGTRLAAAYGTSEAVEGYRCRYGINPAFQAELTAGPLRACADDTTGEVRAVELDDHPFFVATLFQPERAALRGRMPPLVAAFTSACAVAPQRA